MSRGYRHPEPKSTKPTKKAIKAFHEDLKKPLAPGEVRISSLPHYWQLQITGRVHWSRTAKQCPWDGMGLRDGLCKKCGRKYV